MVYTNNFKNFKRLRPKPYNNILKFKKENYMERVMMEGARLKEGGMRM